MSDIADIYDALMSGKRAAESLMSWQTGVDGRDIVRDLQDTIQRGITAYERVQRDLRDGRKHTGPPDYYDPPARTSCYCSEPACAPPCSWCTSGKERDQEEAELFHPNDD